jgi:hypothetical protein
MSIPPNDNSNSLAQSLNRERFRSESPVHGNIESGIYRAITTGQPDPEGRGRLAAYVPKLGQDPDNPMYFQYASPMGGSNSSGSYGFFSVPPDAGVTILVFFAENGELSEGYWFAVAQEVPNVLAGGPSGPARNDGTGQGDGAFTDVPSADTVTGSLSEHQGIGATASGDRGDGLRGSTDSAQENSTSWTTEEMQNVERLRSFNEELGGGRAYAALSPGERAYAIHMGYIAAPAQTNTTGDSAADVEQDDAQRGREQLPPANHDRNVNVAGQGLYSDPVRGQSTASPVRNASYETPQHSSVHGWRTPGSNAITMDDGSISPDGEIHPNQIRIQTGSGASVILDGTNDTIYMVNSTGSGWVEIGAQGEIMAYAQGSFSVRAEGDINLRADQNINMEAGERVNIKSGNNFTVNSGNQAHIKSEGSQFYDSGGSNHTKVATNMYVSTGGDLHLNGPQAAMSPGLPTVSHPDIQESSSTQVDESIMSTMPSHEPMMRANPGVASNFPGGEIADANGGVQPDPGSETGQDDAVNADDIEVVEQEGDHQLDSRLQPLLKRILIQTAEEVGVLLRTTSGLRPYNASTGRDSAGSSSGRHVAGWASDTALIRNGRQLSVNSSADLPYIQQFTRLFFANARAAGRQGSVGWGSNYMGGNVGHFDIAAGTPNPSTGGTVSAAYWGNGTSSAGAPGWLRSMFA